MLTTLLLIVYAPEAGSVIAVLGATGPVKDPGGVPEDTIEML